MLHIIKSKKHGGSFQMIDKSVEDLYDDEGEIEDYYYP